jgi:hypothetical protein
MSDALEEMLKLVASYERERCRDISERAQKEARHIVANARRRARARLREDARELRAAGRRRLALARAELDTARRAHEQRRDLALVTRGWRGLEARLRARWQDPAARGRWVAGAIAQALAVLPRATWTIAHAAGWTETERNGVAEALERQGVKVERVSLDARAQGGIRLCAGGACLDGTIDGLLADRAAIEAMLLAELQV